ncbi:MAG: hypothetical protein HOQ11_08775 [Gemmatimonadaceae bacterium]|nr:hypothetical protein [Gemmatimonadaceae bacterium]NUQ91503.1 hypothetical protein [Gemmatimonadaceae bacterium]NUR33930.1 hypothetical protein [Gemmatimonadaceae bacterium]NUS97487.1 hypothetical protein [Gemmatimonadaceae bacterium]
MTPRSEHGLLLALGLTIAAACTTGALDADERRNVPHRVGTLAKPEWETAAWELGRYKASGTRLDVAAMRAGGPIVALLQRQPLAAYEIILEGPATPRHATVTGGRVQDARYGANPPLGKPVDVIGVSADGAGWYLDADSSRIVSEDVGGVHRVEASLGAHTAPTTGCLLGDRAVAFLDSAHVGTVFVESVAAAADVRALRFPPGFVDDGDVRWTDLRFSGSRGGPCVLWAPRMRTVMLVSDSAVRPMGPLVKPVKREPWYERGWRWITRQPGPTYVIDASSFPGGVALVSGGRTRGARRMIDLYADAGTYRETMVLRMSAMRVAGNGARLYVLRQNGDSVLLASYVLPPAVRALAPESGDETVLRVDRLAGARTAPGAVRLDTSRVVVPRRRVVAPGTRNHIGSP